MASRASSVVLSTKASMSALTVFSIVTYCSFVGYLFGFSIVPNALCRHRGGMDQRPSFLERLACHPVLQVEVLLEESVGVEELLLNVEQSEALGAQFRMETEMEVGAVGGLNAGRSRERLALEDLTYLDRILRGPIRSPQAGGQAIDHNVRTFGQQPLMNGDLTRRPVVHAGSPVGEGIEVNRHHQTQLCHFFGEQRALAVDGVDLTVGDTVEAQERTDAWSVGPQ